MSNDNEETKAPHISLFEAIRREAEDGSEYWSARDLSKILGYALWQKFKNVVDKAEEACLNSGQAVADHFIHVDNMVNIGSGAKRRIEDVQLSREEQKQLEQSQQPSLFEEPTE